MNRSQFCTCIDSSAVVTCAKLWPNWSMRVKSILKIIVWYVDYKLIITLWNGYYLYICTQRTWSHVLSIRVGSASFYQTFYIFLNESAFIHYVTVRNQTVYMISGTSFLYNIWKLFCCQKLAKCCWSLCVDNWLHPTKNYILQLLIHAVIYEILQYIEISSIVAWEVILVQWIWNSANKD